MIQFMLNDEYIELTTAAPNLSILDWLRIHQGKTGTKEGCASGDCGACTVVVGEYQNGEWHYRSVNACLMLIGNLHARHLVTIEALSPAAQAFDDLHPVQRALVECHGSQCGFCTPGFVMSLLALYLNHSQYPGKRTVIHALGGNLCRCTGYQPILNAAQRCFAYPRVSSDWLAPAQLLERLDKHTEVPSLTSGSHCFFLPQDLGQLLQLKHDYPDARFVAGGTDLSLEYSQQLKCAEPLISVSQCTALKRFTHTDTGTFIGSALTYGELVGDFCSIYPETRELFERLGSCQVRNGGTLGGSIGNASPIGDPAPLLIALQAQIEVQSLRGSRRMPLEQFFVDYRKTELADDEVIVGFHLPLRPDGLHLACHKISKRIEDDISAVCLVAAFELEHQQIQNARCAFGGMAAVPARAHHTELALEGQPWSLNTLKSAGEHIQQDFSPLSDVRASAEYRLQVSRNLFTRIWFEQQARIDNVNPSPVTRIQHAAL
ncbi:xanthine dehydrogenase small subunit [Alteromonas aestuariivivens]|uniref:Xanthine dehydrogenase small subunit n=1 Tax=Alteromonas aestuariivivens TaxID=1938339 RepID=A0A3D8MF27_9ALTE|nr:xanthine dehydrogenase small subunit [Alteromonas aestuariivivens]RDV29435.1 xanthine dehydrogenase small subunit [Alteromonas aestuariivivens]